MRILKKLVILLLAVLLLPVLSYASADSEFIRIDRDDPNAWKEELSNVRFLQEEGMSGSAQFSETQFHDLAGKLREQAEEVWIVDCRLESHGLINGIAVSWCGVDNGANLGKTVKEVEAEEDASVINIAVCGRPNVGKSSLVNALLGEQRVIVSDIPGTTRDAIDTPFERDGQKYVLVDTAGIRRKRAVEDATIERYSVIRSLAAVRKADVVLFVCDATEGLSEQDVKIAGYVHEEGKPSVILVNKWDLVEKDTYTIESFKKDMNSSLNFMPYVSYLFISAKTGQRVQKVLNAVNEVYAQSIRRIPTGTLNDIVNEAISMNEPPSQNGRRLKLYYATQVSVQPPTFVAFVNDASLVHFSYERYLENYFRKSFGFVGTPIRIYFRNRTKEDE